MIDEAVEQVPEALRDKAVRALAQAVGGGEVASLSRMTAGASGALAYRVDVAGGPALVLRLETARDVFRNPDRSYPCLVAAAEVGVAPPVLVADAAEGVVVMALIDAVPLEEHPDVVVDVATQLRRLQATDPFPPMLDDFGVLLAQMLEFVAGADLYRAGALDRHRDGLAAIREAYPWSRWPQVSAHNDVNPFNVLSDGTRVWLVDWELAFRNDALADLAGLANGLQVPQASVPAMLEAGLGDAPDALTVARLDVFCQLNRLFYGCLLTSGMLGTAHGVDAEGLSPDELQAAIVSGALVPGTPELLLAFANTQFRAFADRLAADGFAESLRVVRG